MGKLDGWTLVIDLDGTLVETAPDLHAALNHVMQSLDLNSVPLNEVRSMIGDGAKALIRKGLDWNNQPIDEEVIDAQLWPRFIDYYLSHICDLSTPFEGAIEHLDGLSLAGATLSICTNKAQTLAEAVLSGLTISDRFASIVGGDAATRKKPDPAHILETIAKAGGRPDRSIMIGDSQTDERAARAAELPFIFVTFGYGDMSGQPYPKSRSINHWNEIEDAITSLVKT